MSRGIRYSAPLLFEPEPCFFFSFFFFFLTLILPGETLWKAGLSLAFLLRYYCFNFFGFTFSCHFSLVVEATSPPLSSLHLEANREGTKTSKLDWNDTDSLICHRTHVMNPVVILRVHLFFGAETIPLHILVNEGLLYL